MQVLLLQKETNPVINVDKQQISQFYSYKSLGGGAHQSLFRGIWKLC